MWQVQNAGSLKLQWGKHNVGNSVGAKHKSTNGTNQWSNIEVVSTGQISHTLSHGNQHGIEAVYIGVGITEQVNHSKTKEQGNSSTKYLVIGLGNNLFDLLAIETEHSKAYQYYQNKWEQARIVQPL